MQPRRLTLSLRLGQPRIEKLAFSAESLRAQPAAQHVRVHGVARQAVAIFGRAGDACGARTSRSVASARGHDGKWPRQQTWRQRLVDPGHDRLVDEVPQVHALAQAGLMDAEPAR